jgi:hypothetical protein
VLGEDVNLNKKKATIFGVPLTVLVLALVLALFLTASSPNKSWHTVYEGALAAGTPDAHGDRIYSVSVAQNTTGSWSTVAFLDYTSYVNGTTLTFPSTEYTNIFVKVLFAKALAATLGAAQADTRIYLTITGVYTSATMVYSSGYGFDASFWALTYQYPGITTPWIPAIDTSYAITIQYQAYY